MLEEIGVLGEKLTWQTADFELADKVHIQPLVSCWRGAALVKDNNSRVVPIIHSHRGCVNPRYLVNIKVSFQPVNTGRGAYSLSKRMGQTPFSVVWGSLHLLHNKPVTFPALPVPIYTPRLRGVIMVKCLTQGHNMLTVTGLKPTTFCLWTQHWFARPDVPNICHQLNSEFNKLKVFSNPLQFTVI